MSLAEKIRKARQQNVEIGLFTFTVSRPTDVDMLKLRGVMTVEALLGYVVGWDGVKESDLVPGGSPVPVTFDTEIAREWLADRPDLLAPLVDKVLELYSAHVKAKDDAGKN